MLKIRKSVAVLVANIIFVSMLPSNIEAEENLLHHYAQIVENFNNTYGTTYQIASPEQLEMIGSNEEEIAQQFSQMTDDEFWEYLCNAYEADVANNYEIDEITIETIPVEDGIAPATTVAETEQRYYYNSGYTNYLGMTAKWVSVDGANRYSTCTKFSFSTYSYPYFYPYDFSYQLINSAQQMKCTYTCNKFIGSGITDATTWTIPVTFTANGGNIYKVFSA